MLENNNNNHTPFLNLWILLCAGLLGMMPYYAQAGEVTVVEAETVLQENVYHLNAQISYQLDDELIEALHNGVVLPLRINIELFIPHNYWPDEEVAYLKQRYELSYHALSEQYVLLNINSGASESFAYLSRALARLGSIESLPIIDRSLLQEDQNYMVRIQAGVSTGSLAIPLRLLSYIYSEWRVESDWFEWPL